MSDLADLHNQLARRFMLDVVAEIVRAGGKDSDLLVLAESIVFGILVANEKVFGASRYVAEESLDGLVVAVMERLALVPHDGR